MICLDCYKRIPIVSYLSLEKKEFIIGIICQCNNSTEQLEYNIKDYIELIKNSKISEEIIKQKCFLHKEEDIDLYCNDCGREYCRKCDLGGHLSHELIGLDELWEMENNELIYNKVKKDERKDYLEGILSIELTEEQRTIIYELCEIIFNQFDNAKYSMNYAILRNIGYFHFIMMNTFKLRPRNTTKETKKNYIIEKGCYNYTKLNQIDIEFDILDLIVAIPKVNIVYNLNTNKRKVFNYKRKNNNYIIDENETINLLQKETYIKIHSFSLINPNYQYLIITYENGDFEILKYSSSYLSTTLQSIRLYKNEVLNTPKSPITDFAIANNILFTLSSKSKTLKFWSLSSTQCYKILDQTKITYIKGLTYNNYLFTSINFSIPIIQDLNNQRELKIIMNPHSNNESPIKKVYEFQHCQKLAILTYEKSVNIYDLKLGIYKGTLKGHNGIVNDLNELSNGNRCISCSDDNTIRLWNLTTLQCELVIIVANILYPLYHINKCSNNDLILLNRENQMYLLQ